MLAVGTSFAFVRRIVPAVAVYRISRPPMRAT
jgi:hypothetical protein